MSNPHSFVNDDILEINYWFCSIIYIYIELDKIWLAYPIPFKQQLSFFHSKNIY